MALCREHAVLSLHVTVHAVLTVEVGQAGQYFLKDEGNEVFTEASPLLVHGFHQISHSAIGAVLQTKDRQESAQRWVERKQLLQYNIIPKKPWRLQ